MFKHDFKTACLQRNQDQNHVAKKNPKRKEVLSEMTISQNLDTGFSDIVFVDLQSHTVLKKCLALRQSPFCVHGMAWQSQESRLMTADRQMD